MKKIITTAVVGLALLVGLSLVDAEAAQVNAERGVGSHSFGYCLITGEERGTQADCPIGQNKLLSTQGKVLTSEQGFLLAAARQRPQNGSGYKRGLNGGTAQNAGNGKQDGTGPGCADGPRVDDCPYWEEKQETTPGTASNAPTNTSQSNEAQTSPVASNVVETQNTYGQQPQDNTGNQYGGGQGYVATNNSQAVIPENPGNSNGGQANAQAGSTNRGYGNGVCDGSGGGTGRNAGNGLRDGSGAGGQRGRNAGTCVTN